MRMSNHNPKTWKNIDSLIEVPACFTTLKYNVYSRLKICSPQHSAMSTVETLYNGHRWGPKFCSL